MVRAENTSAHFISRVWGRTGRAKRRPHSRQATDPSFESMELIHLPRDILRHVCGYLSLKDVVSLRACASRMRSALSWDCGFLFRRAAAAQWTHFENKRRWEDLYRISVCRGNIVAFRVESGGCGMAHWTHSTQLSGKMYCGATAGTYYALFSQTSSFIIADGQGVCRRTRRPGTTPPWWSSSSGASWATCSISAR